MNTLSFAFGTDNKDKGEAWNVDYNFASLRYENMYPLHTIDYAYKRN